jgi:hypothetical protein
VAVFKNFRFSERTNLQFRTELFNVLTQPQYLNPGTSATFNVDPTAPAGSFPTRYVQTNTTFGVITGTRDPRTIQFWPETELLNDSSSLSILDACQNKRNFTAERSHCVSQSRLGERGPPDPRRPNRSAR